MKIVGNNTLSCQVYSPKRTVLKINHCSHIVSLLQYFDYLTYINLLTKL